MESNVKYHKFIIPIVVGLLIWALTPFKPDAVDPQAWYMFAIFVATIIAVLRSRCRLALFQLSVLH